jgi:hypothetical protein
MRENLECHKCVKYNLSKILSLTCIISSLGAVPLGAVHLRAVHVWAVHLGAVHIVNDIRLGALSKDLCALPSPATFCWV